MAQAYTSGPCPLYAGVGLNGAPVFLGHAERFPRIQIRPRWSDVYCDLSGQSVPYDQVYDGEDAVVTADLTRWNESVYAVMADRAKTNSNFLAITSRGANGFGEIGSLMVTEGLAYNLYVVFPFAAKAAYSATMPLGYRFQAAFLQGPDDFELGGTARKLRLSWRCLRSVQSGAMQTTAGAGANNYGGAIKFVLYDNGLIPFVWPVLPSVN